jgi:hypothetical protein
MLSLCIFLFQYANELFSLRGIVDSEFERNRCTRSGEALKPAELTPQWYSCSTVFHLGTLTSKMSCELLTLDFSFSSMKSFLDRIGTVDPYIVSVIISAGAFSRTR